MLNFNTNIVKYTGIIFLLLLISCNSEQEVSVPQNLPLSEEQLADVLVDIHILEARLEKTRLTPKELYTPVKLSYQQIFDKHQVSQKDYEATLKFYLEHPIQFDHLYEIVITKLSKKEAELNARVKKKVKEDSTPKE